MLYRTIEVKGKEYKLRLTTRRIIELERKLGTNPVNALRKFAVTNEIPSFDYTVTCLHYALQEYQSDSFDDTYALVDTMMEEGKEQTDILVIVTDVFGDCGLMENPNKQQEVKDETKEVVGE